MKKTISVAFALCLFAGISPPSGAGSGSDSSPGAAPRLTGKMPQTVLLGSIANLYEPVKFNHAGHVTMASGCGDCHHQHGTEQTLACRECHTLDPSSFRKTVAAGGFKACKDCHPASVRPGAPDRPGLKAAYHRACFKCHRGEVGTVGTDPKGCTEMCHAPAARAKSEQGR